MSIEIEKIVNGKRVKVALKDANKPNTNMSDKDRLERYRGEKAEAEKMRKEGLL